MPRHARQTFSLLCVAVGSARLPCSSLGFAVPSMPAAPSKDRSGLFMDLAASHNAELLLVARFAEDDGKAQDRLESLSTNMGAKHGGRVAVQLQEEPYRCAEEGSPSEASKNLIRGCLPAFRLVRAGLAIDEYHTHGDAPYEEELDKRVDAALSLSRTEDSATLKELWSPDAAGGDYRDEMAVATYAVQVASTVARELQEELCDKGAISKTDSSPVTVADFSVQAIVLGILSRYFPDHGFIAEETSSVLREEPASLSAVLAVVSKVLCRDLTETELCAAIDLGTRGHGKHQRGHWGRGGRTWVLDPIDGTKGFLRGEQFCVALGLLDGGKAVAGVLGCPNLPADEEHLAEGWRGGEATEEAARFEQPIPSIHAGLLYTAALGEGTFVRALSAGGDDTRRVMVDHARRPCETRVLESVEPTHTSHAVAAEVCSDLEIELPPIRVDGQCKYGLLSQGQGGIYLRLPRWGYVENIWDHVAGAVVIREAGGKVTDSRGEALDFSLGAKLPREVVGVVATSGKIHAEVIKAVHNRQMEDWARVVAEAKRKGWEGGDSAPPLPGVDWECCRNAGTLGDEWWATALAQKRPLVMRTSEQFYGALERGWDKLVAVLFHGSWTQESQHAVSILENLANRQRRSQHQDRPFSLAPAPAPARENAPQSSPQKRAAAASTAGLTGEAASPTEVGAGGRAGGAAECGISIVLAEADVMSLIEVADRQAIGGLPSLHVHLGGRELVRFPVDHGESADSLGERIAEVAGRVCGAGMLRRHEQQA